MSKPALVPIGSWWSSNRSPARVFIVIERLPFGRVCIKEEGRAYFGESQQKQFLANFTRLDDAQ